MINRAYLVVLMLSFAAALHVRADDIGTMAELTAETLAGKRLALPKDLPDAPCVLIIGFSRASGAATREWSQKLRAHGQAGSSRIFSALILDEAPRFVRGMIVKGMKKDIPAAQHEQYLVVTENGVGWKQLAGYTNADAAYIVLTTAAGRVIWRTSGPPTDAALQEVARRIAEAAT